MLTSEHAISIWKLMTPEEKLDLWRENCESNHFYRSWSFVMFRTSTSIMWQAMSRRFDEERGVLNLNEQKEEV